MADPLWGQQLTNMWMLDPTMFDPTQRSNQFSNYNNAPLPGPSYNTGAGGPTNAMGQPIPAFQAWQAANPAGMNINNTPAQAAQQQAPAASPAGAGGQVNYQAMGQYGPAIQELMGNYAAAQAKLTPQQQYNQAQANAVRQQMMNQQNNLSASANAGGGFGQSAGGAFNPGQTNYTAPQPPQSSAPAVASGSQTPTAPDNWMAALNALSQPGNPVTRGANVPMASGFQPSGGVNQAFLGQVQTPGANQNFLSALAAIQGRPQGQQQQRRTG